MQPKLLAMIRGLKVGHSEGLKEGLEKGHKQGIEQGKKENNLSIAKKNARGKNTVRNNY